MREFLISILGEYSPVTYESFVNVNGETLLVDVIPNGLAGVDWLYVLTGLLFVVVIFCVLKVIGGLICKMF